MWDIIKKNLSKEGNKCIVIEGEDAVYSVQKIKPESNNSPGTEVEKTEKINRDIDQWNAEEEEKKKPEIDQEDTGVTVEDLPL